MRSTTTISLLVSLIAIHGTARGVGPFCNNAESLRETVLWLQIFCVLTQLCAMLAAAMVAQWRTANSEVKALNASLEQRVAELNHEITRREQVETELRKRKSVLRSFFNSAPMMMGISELPEGEDNMTHIACNPATAVFLSRPLEALEGKTAVEIGISTDRMKLWAHHYRQSERTGKPVRFSYGYKSEAGYKHLCVTVSFITKTADGRSRFSYIAEDITEQKLAQHVLERSAAILDATTDFVAVMDTAGHLIYINRAGRALVGLEEDEDVSTSTLLSYQPKWAHPLVRLEGVPVAMLEGSWQGEAALCATNGKEIPVSQLILSHKSPSGSIEFLSTIIRDMSPQKEAEQEIKNSLAEKEVLLKEIHHRVKNNMQIISSLLQLQATYIHDPQVLRIFEESCDRIRSMALIHEKLYQSHSLAQVDFPEYLRSLVAMVFSAHRAGHQRIETSIHVDPVSFSIDTAIPVGLIANELITNSLKYAFSERDTGRIEVELRKNANDRYTLVVRDDGVGMPKGFAFAKANSLGLRLVRILTKQIQGEIEYSNGTGSAFQIHFNEIQHS